MKRLMSAGVICTLSLDFSTRIFPSATSKAASNSSMRCLVELVIMPCSTALSILSSALRTLSRSASRMFTTDVSASLLSWAANTRSVIVSMVAGSFRTLRVTSTMSCSNISLRIMDLRHLDESFFRVLHL